MGLFMNYGSVRIRGAFCNDLIKPVTESAKQIKAQIVRFLLCILREEPVDCVFYKDPPVIAKCKVI